LIELLDNLLVRSLLEIYGAVFAPLLEEFGSILAIVSFSVVLNVALMPLYYQMEQAGRAGRERQQRMNAEIARMKAHYKGRERYYYIRTVHRQFGYQPLSVVLASGDLYLQIAVFATVYRFLSQHPALSMGWLGRPDGWLYGVNLLPLLMTFLNVGAAMLYGTDRSKRTQSFTLAAVFLVLLYASPGALVLYWTCNNAFSLIRNFVEKKVMPVISSKLPPWMTRAPQQG
jgi:membrane protein insertase Oxa1/YidC/SpoIIIJ